MPGTLYHVGASASCPHQGQIAVVSSNTRVLVNGMAVATVADMFQIAGCVFTVPPGKPQPCMSVRWLVPATRVVVNGSPALLQTSTGLCLSAEQAPQGPATITATQTRVVAT
jgi:hypothetical protein